MKRVLAEFPYNDYYLYIIFHKKEGRNYANLIPINKQLGLKRHTISYARYLMSVKEKRILSPSEHIDHIDNNKLNDTLENLQIVSLKENNIKEAKRRGKNMVLLKCPNCDKIFERVKNKTHLQNKSRYTSCSKTCCGYFSALLYKNPNNLEVLNKLKTNVIKEYVTHD